MEQTAHEPDSVSPSERARRLYTYRARAARALVINHAAPVTRVRVDFTCCCRCSASRQ